jgi:predicted permease
VRLALGATRVRLVRQLLLESVLLSLGGGMLGILLSVWATYALRSFKLPAPMPLDLAIGVDWRVMVYTFGLSLTVGFLCGFMPAWTGSRPVMPDALKGEESLGRTRRAWSLRNILVVVQISMSLVLLCGAGLFLRSLEGASRIDTGFRPNGVVILGIDPPTHSYTPLKTIQLLSIVRQQILTLPGVLNATVTDGVPLSGGHRSDGFVAEGRPSTKATIVDMFIAGPGYFQTLGIPRLAGREFGVENPSAPKVTIVNEELVRRFFPGENPIGRRIVDASVPYEIVGVVKNTKSRTIGEDQRPIMYRPIEQTVERDPSMEGYQFMVRYQGDSTFLVEAIRRVINAQDTTLAVFNVQTMDEHLRDAMFLPRLAGSLFAVFGSIGVLLASIGLYGVVSYSVSQRTREIGIRMALGARADVVQRLIVREGMYLSLVSFGLGLSIALAAAKLATSVLYGVRPYDVATFTAVPIVLFAITLGACWIPARRASRVDPMISLRVD